MSKINSGFFGAAKPIESVRAALASLDEALTYMVDWPNDLNMQPGAPIKYDAERVRGQTSLLLTRMIREGKPTV